MWEYSALDLNIISVYHVILFIYALRSRYASDCGLSEDNSIKNKSEFPISSVALRLTKRYAIQPSYVLFIEYPSRLQVDEVSRALASSRKIEYKMQLKRGGT